MTTKQIMLIVMCVLLVAVLVTACIVMSKVSALFDMLNATTPPTEPSVPTDPSSEPTNPITDPSSEPTSEPTEPTEPPVTGPHEHKFVWTTNYSPTCTGMGYTLYTCECGKTNTTNFKDPLGHEYGEPEVFELTCEQDGYTLMVCQRCNVEERRNEQIAPGHDYQFAGVVAPSCTAVGYDAYICTRCNDVRKENVVDALEHTFGEWTPIEGTDREARTCSACETTELRSIGGEADLTIRKTRNDENPDWTHYVITLTHLQDETTVTFDIYIGLEDRDITYVYSNESFEILCSLNGEPLRFTLSAEESAVLTVDANGEKTDEAPKDEPDEPEPTDPTDPTEPSDPTDPTEETEPSDPTEETDPTEEENE